MLIANFTQRDEEIELEGLWQYDYGQKLQINGLDLPAVFEVHFAYKGLEKAIPQTGYTQDGVSVVDIPNSALAQPKTISAYIYLSDASQGETTNKILLYMNKRIAPEGFEAPADVDLFHHTLEAVNEYAKRTAESEKSAAAWVHGHEDYPDRAEDNAAYYAGVAGENAGSAHGSMVETQHLAERVHYDADVTARNAALAEQYKSQAAQSAADALQSEQNAKASETAAQEAQAGAETAEGQTELFAAQAEEDKNAVEQAKAVVMEIGQKVADNKKTIEQTVDNFELLHEQAVADINNAGQAQTERVNEAGETAVDNIEFSRQQAAQSVTNEGATQIANVQAAAEEIAGKVEQIDQNTQGISELKGDLVNIGGINLSGAVVQNYWNPDTVEYNDDFWFNTNGERQPKNDTIGLVRIPVRAGKSYKMSAYIGWVYSFILQNKEYSFIGKVDYTKNDEIFTFSVPENENEIVWVSISYRKTSSIFYYLIEDREDLFSDKPVTFVPWLISKDVSPDTRKEIRAYVDGKFPVSYTGLSGNMYNLVDTRTIVTNKEIKPDKSIIESSGNNYFIVEVQAGKTYSTNIYAIQGHLYDFGMNYIGEVVYSKVDTNAPRWSLFSIPDSDSAKLYLAVNYSRKSIDDNEDVVIYETSDTTSITDKRYPRFGFESNCLRSIRYKNGSITAEAFAQNLPPYVFDGFGCTNYWDAEYVYKNGKVWNSDYTVSPWMAIPKGTYTINNAYSVCLSTVDGRRTKVSVTSNTECTFTIDDENVMYRAIVKRVGLDELRKVIVQEGTTTNGITDRVFTAKNLKVENLGYYPTHWFGKNYVAVGDSVTRGYAPKNDEESIAEGSQIPMPYAKWAAQQLGLNLTNRGWDGTTVYTTITYNVLSEVMAMSGENAPDVITIMLGANDATYLETGTIDDMYVSGMTQSECTYYGGLNYIVKSLRDTFPMATIILLSNSVFEGRTEKRIALNDAKKAVAEKYHVLYFDIFESAGFDYKNTAMAQKLQIDNIHPNHYAHEMLGSRLTGFIASH